MKYAPYLIILLIVLLYSSCEKIYDEQEKVISENRPVLRVGSSNNSQIVFNKEGKSYNNPFSGLQLDNPEAIALIEESSIDIRKGLHDENIVYQVVQIREDSINLLSGYEGNDIFMVGVNEILDVNEQYKIFYTQGEIVLTSYEQIINSNFEINIDSIFSADTIPVGDETQNPWPNFGDTIFLKADTLLFNDTLWIQLTHIYSDTLLLSLDTIYSPINQNYNSLLLNTEDGRLFDIAEGIFRLNNGYSDLLYYCDSNNSIFFSNGSQEEICEIKLDNHTLETHKLPYALNTWGILDNMILSDGDGYPNIFCYQIGEGLLTKNNMPFWAGWSNPIECIFSIGSNLYCWGYADVDLQQIFMGIDVDNDSIIFTPLSCVGCNNFNNIIRRHIYYGDEEWFQSGSAIWHYEPNENRFKSIEFHNYGDGNHLLSNGSKYLFVPQVNSIYRIDLEELNAIDFLNLSDVEIKGVNMGLELNLFVHCLRFSDLRNITLEICAKTGDILNEWDEGAAPLESKIVSLSPVLNDN